ncbi:MAG: M48 family metalloprotease, partial [Thermodesulfobacteriota bacterium]
RMYGNFIYFIIALLIYSTYQPASEPTISPLETFAYTIALTLGYALLAWVQLRRLENKLSPATIFENSNQFNRILNRQIALAIFVFAIYVYGLNLSFYTSRFLLFQRVPTLEAVMFLLLFIGHLAVAWALAHRVYCRIQHSNITMRAYVFSNLMFSIPVLIPWLMLSLVSDLILALPFQMPKQLVSTTAGEITYFLLFLLFVALLAPAIIQRFWRCKPLQNGPHRTHIEALCRSAGLHYKDILLWPIFEGRMITAGVMGLIRRFRYILVTRSLLQRLTPYEIDAVIAHEIGHVKKKHLLFYLVFFVGYMLVSYAMFDLIVYAMIYFNPMITWTYRLGLDQATVLPALFSLVIIAAFLLYFRYIFGYFMRNFERQADIYVFDLLGTVAPLITTLEKIALASGEPDDKPNWHHFNIRERIDYLKLCIADPSWISRHHAKVRRSIGVYLIVIVLLGAVGIKLNFGQTGRNLDSHFYEKIILQEISKEPENADLYVLLGDLYYGRDKHHRASRAYEQAINLSKNNSRALNNLAWLYATTNQPGLSDPVRALELAERAVFIEQAPHIFDTLAECYFVNGRVAEAIQASQQALARADMKGNYYEEQLRRFESEK